MAIQLEQSPFLSLISDQRIQKTLGLMDRPPDAQLTPELAREICERTASAAVLDGSIATRKPVCIGVCARRIAGLENPRSGAGASRKKRRRPECTESDRHKFRTRVGESLATVEATRYSARRSNHAVTRSFEGL